MTPPKKIFKKLFNTNSNRAKIVSCTTHLDFLSTRVHLHMFISCLPQIFLLMQQFQFYFQLCTFPEKTVFAPIAFFLITMRRQSFSKNVLPFRKSLERIRMGSRQEVFCGGGGWGVCEGVDLRIPSLTSKIEIFTSKKKTF